MEASSSRVVGYDNGLSETKARQPTIEDQVFKVLELADRRQDRHMTRERIAQELGVSGKMARGAINQVIKKLANAERITERLNIDVGETTYHLPRDKAQAQPPSLFELMVKGELAKTTPEGRYPCPYCPEETRTENGRRIHIGRVHKGKAQLPRTAQASCSTPKPSGMLALLSGGVTPTPPPTDDEEDEDDDELPDVLEGAGVTSIAALHRQLMLDAGKHGWTIEVLQASKPQGEGAVRFSYTHAASKVAS